LSAIRIAFVVSILFALRTFSVGLVFDIIPSISSENFGQSALFFLQLFCQDPSSPPPPGGDVINGRPLGLEPGGFGLGLGLVTSGLGLGLAL